MPVRVRLASAILAMPKSRILTCPLRVMATFAGLMSRWMIPAAWACPSPPRAGGCSPVLRPPAAAPAGCGSAAFLRRSTASPGTAGHRAPARPRRSCRCWSDPARPRPSPPGGTAAGAGIGAHRRGQKLEGHRPVEPAVQGPEHHAHAAAPELFPDLVAADRLAGVDSLLFPPAHHPRNHVCEAPRSWRHRPPLPASPRPRAGGRGPRHVRVPRRARRAEGRPPRRTALPPRGAARG